MPVLFRGMNQNVSWSFGSSVIDILLDILLAPEQSLCTYPGAECENSPNVAFQRSTSENTDYDDDNILLKCDRHNLVGLNDTMCADILKGSRMGSSTSVITFCQALSSLSPNQIEKVWSNTCYVIQGLLSPLLIRPPDCPTEATQSPQTVPPSSQAAPLPRPAPHRAAREALNLKQLACIYSTWLESNVVDPVLVSLCSDNEREEFVKQVCHNALLMRRLLSDPMNSWLYGYCANSSADREYMVGHFCVYEQWISQPSAPVDPFLLEFCLNLDGPRLLRLICEHTGLFMLLFSNPENGRFMPNCTNLPPPPPLPDMDSLKPDSCRYSEWHDLTQININVLSQCIRLDHSGFTQEVCSNRTFLTSLLGNTDNAWLEEHCSTSLSLLQLEPTEPFNIVGWCDYHTWGERQVDDSVVGLCWQYDQLAFQKNVCCKADVLEKLLQDPRNKWLTSVCADLGEIDEITVSPEVGIYLDDDQQACTKRQNDGCYFNDQFTDLCFCIPNHMFFRSASTLSGPVP